MVWHLIGHPLHPLYADDTKLYRSIVSVADCEGQQQALTNLDTWNSVNNLKFNASKCKVLTVTRKRSPILHTYQLGSKELLRVGQEKDLGITLTSNLSWDTHINVIVAKSNKLLGLLKRTCPLLTDIKVRRTLYLSLVKSQVSYATEVWSPVNIHLKSKIAKIQRRATAWILKSKQVVGSSNARRRDLIGEKTTVAKLQTFKDRATEIFRDATFTLHKWHSNAPELEEPAMEPAIFSTSEETFAKQQLATAHRGNQVFSVFVEKRGPTKSASPYH
ncbi:Hypothetical predicted protein [Paramuricea clavata]|uniref:Uncharacterized protein n=1 Tax=Paramuricea clavata TaxID=317549 RepID=A0A7D9LU25_PARCT|nr:Hypothetical predicted protein [Paramuricea clavata]